MVYGLAMLLGKLTDLDVTQQIRLADAGRSFSSKLSNTVYVQPSSHAQPCSTLTVAFLAAGPGLAFIHAYGRRQALIFLCPPPV